MIRRLSEANIKRNPRLVQDVIDLMNELNQGCRLKVASKEPTIPINRDSVLPKAKRRGRDSNPGYGFTRTTV